MRNISYLIFSLIIGLCQKTNFYKGISMRFILIFTIFLSSCSIMEDPSQTGGLVSTATNIVTGSYDERLQKRQEILADAKVKNLQLQQDTYRLETDKLTLSQQIEGENQKLTAIDSTINSFEKKLMNNKPTRKADKKNQAEQLRKLNELKSRNKKLQQQINASNNLATIMAVQEERDRLNQELDLLLEAAQ